jgi:hypothetical protein
MTDFHVTVPQPRPRHGRYLDEATGERYARVSTILGTIAKPGIGMWRERLIRNGDDPDAITREAADRGTAVHQLLQNVDERRMTICPPDLRPFLTAYLDWTSRTVKRFLMIEETVISRRLQYAGTLDRLAVLHDGRRVIVDLKTGRSVDAIYRLQQIAYALALEENGVDVDGRMIVHLPWDRSGTLTAWEYDETARDRQAWVALVRLYHWHRQTAGEWKATR